MATAIILLRRRYSALDSILMQCACVMGISMVPVLELRAAIPFGVAMGLPLSSTVLLAIIGNIIPVPALILFTRSVFRWLRRQGSWGKRIDWLESRAHLKGRVVRKYRLLGLVILVAIPLPGTGAWTGALVATVFRTPMRQALPAIFIGVLIAGAIVTGATFGVTQLWT